MKRFALATAIGFVSILASGQALGALPRAHEMGAARTPPLASAPMYINLGSTKGQLIDLMAVDSAAQLMYVAHKSLGTVDVVDLASNTLITSINGVPLGNGIALDVPRHRAFVGEEGDSSVVIIDTAAQKSVAKIPTGGKTTDATVYVPGLNRVYADNDDSNTMTVIDPDTRFVVGTIGLPGVPELVAYNPNDGLLYQSISDISVIAVIDPSAMTVLRTIPLRSGLTGPKGLFVDVLRNRLWVATLTPAVAVIDLGTSGQIASIPVPSGVDDLQFDAQRRLVYQPSKSGTLSIIDANSLSVVQQVGIAKGSHTALVNPLNGTVYVGEQSLDRLSVLPLQFESGSHARLASQSPWISTKVGSTVTLTVALTNTGGTTWTKGTVNELRVGTNQPRDGLDEANAFGTAGWLMPNRLARQNEQSVASGQVATFTITIQAKAAGTFTLHVAPVIDGQAWLEDDGVFWTVTVTT